jgi:UDP-glucose 4-epimerase
VRDAARACRLALLDRGSERFAVYNIAAPWPFACDDAERRLTEAYGPARRREGWRAGEAVYDSSRAAAELGFRARWRWTPEGIAES